MAMITEYLPAYDFCRCCGGNRIASPTYFDSDSWLVCFDCGERMTTWPDYKQRALSIAAKTLRRQAQAAPRR
jgi:hypothetical protein